MFYYYTICNPAPMFCMSSPIELYNLTIDLEKCWPNFRTLIIVPWCGWIRNLWSCTHFVCIKCTHNLNPIYSLFLLNNAWSSFTSSPLFPITLVSVGCNWHAKTSLPASIEAKNPFLPLPVKTYYVISNVVVVEKTKWLFVINYHERPI